MGMLLKRNLSFMHVGADIRLSELGYRYFIFLKALLLLLLLLLLL
jgi:hypothetical protein